MQHPGPALTCGATRTILVRMKPPAIAIDGPAASGKSTVARRVAEELGYTFINTGAMYRAIAWHLARRGVAATDREKICAQLGHMPLQFGKEGTVSTVLCEGKRLSAELTEPEVNESVSSVAAIPEVRAFLLQKQREYNEREAVVMEGRDIGTVVFPDTPFKYFVTASEEVRAARRAAQGLTDSISERDKNDRERACSPLTQAADARVIDTSDMTIEQVVTEIVTDIRNKMPTKS